MATRHALFLALLSLVAFVPDLAAREPSNLKSVGKATEPMRLAAVDWLATLGDELRQEATFGFDRPERTDWHFVPKDRIGVSLKQMNLPQRRAAHRLLRSALTSTGYLKVTTIMSLESVLRQLEADRPNVESIRDPEKYSFVVFGDPSNEGDDPWGWRYEGHHVSLNFTSANDADATQTIAAPIFLGANPAEIRIGPRQGLRVLAAEGNYGREIMRLLDEEQRASARIAEDAPSEIAGVPGAPPEIAGPVGLRQSEMSDRAQSAIANLFREILRVPREEISLNLVAPANLVDPGDDADEVYFAWAGSLATLENPGTKERFYFRLHTSSFIYEFDYVGPNHVHTVLHSINNDFGKQTLRQHHQQHAH